MRSIWGPVTEIRDLGVVAEQCLHCQRVTPCLLRSVSRGDYLLFIKMVSSTTESSCLCTICLKAIPRERWRYATVVPIKTAMSLPIEELIARTNPGLAERLEFQEQISALGGDAGFAVAYEQLESMRPGALRSELLKELLHWKGLSSEQRPTLGQQIGTQTLAWQFACQIAPTFPRSAGCLPSALAALVVWSAFLWLPAVRNWLWGSITLGVGVAAAIVISQLLHTRKVCQWTREVLIPEIQDADVSLDGFLAVVDDLPASRLGLTEALWPLKAELETIRRVLSAEGRL